MGPLPPDTAPLTLEQAIDLAIARNLDLAAVRSEWAVREGEVRAAGQRPNPDLSTEVTRDTPRGDVTVAFPFDPRRSRRVAVAREELAATDIRSL